MSQHYFFCGIGGSGMLPLAMIIKGQGHEVSGSDRSYDQGLSVDKFHWINEQGIKLFPQDGLGLIAGMILVVSTAIEASIPDVKRAQDLGLKIIKRADLLSSLFNAAETRIGVAGTSGKSTTTGMVSYALSRLDKNPTMMNGAVVKDFVSDKNPYATFLNGDANLFISEIDESDGSIALYNPSIAVINNIALDHKPLDELIPLFVNYAAKAEQIILPYNAPYIDEVKVEISADKVISFGFDARADIFATDLRHYDKTLSALIHHKDQKETLSLNVIGEHNMMNALAALSVLRALGFSLAESCKALSNFSGIKRRMEFVGQSTQNITVIDDFAHNPDKITASLKTLKHHQGRLIILFQMHGFGPLRLMRQDLLEVFTAHLNEQDHLYMPEVLYLGGTVDRSYTTSDFITELKTKHKNAYWFETRDDVIKTIISEAKPHDRIIIMGARDDTLSDVAKFILSSL